MKVQSAEMLHVGSLEELQARQVIVVRGADRPIAVWLDRGKVQAVDNRCPHMGFPLHKGTVREGILTCHWHQARFDLCSGCTFDLFADDVPAYDTFVEDGQVYVAPRPRQPEDADYHLRRLHKGLEQNIALIQAKSLTGLLGRGVPLARVLGEIALYGSRFHEEWGTGMTMLTLVANLAPDLSDETAYFALCRAAQQVAANCAGAPPRRSRLPLEGGEHDLPTLQAWMRQWARARHRDGAERTLLTALRDGVTTADLADLLFTAVNDRLFSSTGHTLDFCNKAFELVEALGSTPSPPLPRNRGERAGVRGADRPERMSLQASPGLQGAEDVFPLVLEQLASARGAEESAHWHHPIEIAQPVFALHERLPELLAAGAGKAWQADGPQEEGLLAVLLGEDPLAILDTLAQALAAGVPPRRLAQWVAYAAGLRLARFATSNDVNDWFDVQHTFSYCNAVYQTLGRSTTPGVVRGLFHGAIAVYQDRFLNVPPARLPGERGSLDDLPREAGALRQALLEALDQRAEVEAAARLVARYLRLGHPAEPLIDTLTYATVREDIDFHSLQVLEAGVRQYRAWNGGPRGEHLLVGVVRNLAAHCPTRRGALQIATIALRLDRGDKVYEED